jgi:hypothetical protein
MTRISDPSGDLSAMWPWQVWAIFIAGVVVMLFGFWLVDRLTNGPTQDGDVSEFDRLDGKGRVL